MDDNQLGRINYRRQTDKVLAEQISVFRGQGLYTTAQGALAEACIRLLEKVSHLSNQEDLPNESSK